MHAARKAMYFCPCASTSGSSGGLTVEIQRKIVGQIILAHLHVRTEGLAEGLHDLRIIVVKDRVSPGVSRAEEINRHATCAGVVHLVQQALDGWQVTPKIDIERAGRQDIVKRLVAESL